MEATNVSRSIFVSVSDHQQLVGSVAPVSSVSPATSVPTILLGNGNVTLDATLNATLDADLGGGSNASSVGQGGLDNWFLGSNSRYTPVKAVLIGLLLLCVVLVTVVGNILVCVAVCLVRKLRRPCNYLLVSLAVSDICVAILVMPLALLYEIKGKWDLGRFMCDLWVSFDVLSCTASILNLCMISVDRYYAITKPLEYGVKRTPRRMIKCVALVWLGAACISLPPLFILGNENTPPKCTVCQNFGYQIYATLLAFYIPLTVMIVVYYKIFRAARRIVLEERRAQTHLETHPYVQTAQPPTPPPQTMANNGCMANNRNTLSSHSLLAVGGAADAAGAGGDGGGGGSGSANAGSADAGDSRSTGCESSGGTSRCFTARRSDESQCPMLGPDTASGHGSGNAANRSPTQSSAPASASRRSRLSAAKKAAKAARRSPSSTMSLLRQHRHSTTQNQVGGAAQGGASGGGGGGGGSSSGVPLAAASHTKKLRFALAKERKASTTLGIIMSAFIVCWLPFFVLALVRPFLEVDPTSVASFFLWLGYANSLLNPIIYATLNRDFRRPFQQILYFRCGSLNHMMREEFYQSQYGDPDPAANYYHAPSQCEVGRLTPPPQPLPLPSPPPPLQSRGNDDLASDLASDEETLTSGGLITVSGSQRDRSAANESFL